MMALTGIRTTPAPRSTFRSDFQGSMRTRKPTSRTTTSGIMIHIPGDTSRAIPLDLSSTKLYPCREPSPLLSPK